MNSGIRSLSPHFMFVLLATGLLRGPVHAQPAQQATVVLPRDTSTVQLTIAQSGAALVKDRRPANLVAGRTLMRIPDVAARLAPESVQSVISGGAPVEVLQQNFRNESVSSVRDILHRFVGQSVTLLRTGEPAVKGTLLAADNVILLETADGLMIDPPGSFMVPRGTTSALPVPTLEWFGDVRATGAYNVEARYSTPGLSWRTSYRASLSPDRSRLSLRAWMELSNSSGASFRNAAVALKPGSLEDKSPLISLPQPIDLPTGESRQVLYASAPDIPATTEYLVNGAELQPDFGKFYSARPRITARLRNSADIGLGQIFPAGALTAWATAADGSLVRLGDGALPFTLPDQKLWIPLGEAEKLNVARAVTANRQLNPTTREYKLQIAVTNETDAASTVTVIEPFPANGKITETTLKPVTQDEKHLEFTINVPANDTATVKYVVEVK